MRTGLKTAFRPSLESFEPRIVATAGLSAAAAHHPAHVAAQHATTVSAAVQHPAHVAVQHETKPATTHHPAHATKRPAPPTTTTSPSRTKSPAPTQPANTTTNQAWVELVNMTGQDLEYQIKLAPYANGQFLPFDIAPGAAQYRFSSLTSNGRRVNADFAIQFGNGPVTPLLTGISQQSAQKYYIFMDSNFQYYVSPFVASSSPTIPTPTPTQPANATTNQAWVELVNMTGQDLEYQIKLAPYANGQFLPFDIAPGAAQYRFSSLISNGRRVNADFAIQFGNGPVTPLLTGISQQAAQGYYIFMDSNFQYYVSPFFRS